MPRLWADGSALRLLPGVPGVADGPVRVGGVAAVGEVTLHNGRTLRAALGTDVPAGMASRCPRAASRSNASAGLASAKW